MSRDLVIRHAARTLALELARKYRVEAIDIESEVQEILENDYALKVAAQGAGSLRALRRTRAYRDASSRTKSKLYYKLRTFKRDVNDFHAITQRLIELADQGTGHDNRDVDACRSELLQKHVSTAERSEGDIVELLNLISKNATAKQNILDLGSGVFPLSIPAGFFEAHVSSYLALDRDPACVRAVNAWARFLPAGILEGRLWTIDEGFGEILREKGQEGTDLTLALKLIPMVERQERNSLSILCSTPSVHMLITGAKNALVKRHSVGRREERSLRQFARICGFEVLGRFETSSELGLVLGRETCRHGSIPQNRV